VAGLAIVLPASGQVYLVDAGPDLREQLDLLRDARDAPADRVDRSPVDGVFLTHAHIGHYLGLAFFGFEAIHTRDLPVYSTTGMAEYLRNNGPWSQLVGLGNVRLEGLDPEDSVDIGDGVHVTAVKVPHRDEYADTIGLRIAGPRRSVFYVPDTDSWAAWEQALTELLEGVDVALLDGTFYSIDELPGRRIEEIGHPLILDSMDLLQEPVDSGDLAVFFTHLNHSNPALDPAGPEHAEIVSRGFAVLQEGQEIEL
jgi:pyrroloquinoline quinone biosynthesis protein B